MLELSAQDNLALHGGFAKGFGGRVLWREQEKVTRQLLKRFGVDIDIHQPLAAATPVERTVVAIAAALQGWHGGGGLLVLDEPTAVLPHDEVERLFAVVQEVRKAGTAILYVSHRMDEIFELADRVTILRGGRLVGTHDIATLDPRALAGLMVGEDVDPGLPCADRGEAGRAGGARGARCRRQVAARRQPRRPPGRDPGPRRPRRRGRARAPVRHRRACPPRRQGDRQSCACPRTPTRGTTSPGSRTSTSRSSPRTGSAKASSTSSASTRTCRCRSSAGSAGAASSRCREEARTVEEWSRRLEIKTESPGSLISTLSGGNQQKVVVARCLASDPKILVLCEPTAGVDIGTRVAIYDLVARLAREGLTVIVSSSDEGDLLAHVHADRGVAKRNGRRGDERRRTDTAGARERDRRRELDEHYQDHRSGPGVSAARNGHGAAGPTARLPAAASRRWPSTRSGRSTSGSRSSSSSRSGRRTRSRRWTRPSRS